MALPIFINGVKHKGLYKKFNMEWPLTLDEIQKKKEKYIVGGNHEKE